MGTTKADGGTTHSRAAGTKGRVTLTLAGAAVTPPAFAGGLPELHDWLMANQAALQSYSGKIRVRFSGTVQQEEQVIWAYWHPQQELVLEGAEGAVVTGFRETGGKEYATPGYFLAYRPIIPQKMTAENPAAANLDMHGLTVKGFASGGVEISPRSGKLPSAEEMSGFDPESGHGDGGLAAFVSGAHVEHNTFEEMGTKYMKKGTERYDPKNPEGYKYAGYGGIVARGLNASVIAGNTFRNLENRESERKSAEGGKVNWTGLMHGVYLRDHSSRNAVRKNRFEGISGAAVKFTNAADYNKVRDNRADNVGKDAFVLDHSAASNPGGAPEADSRGYSNRGIDRAADGRKYIAGNQVGAGWSGYGRREKLKMFEEKRVGS